MIEKFDPRIQVQNSSVQIRSQDSAPNLGSGGAKSPVQKHVTEHQVYGTESTKSGR